MNNQEGMLAAASVLRVQGESRPLCPGTPSSSAPTTPGLMDTAWQSLLAQEESCTAPSAKPAAVKLSSTAGGWRNA